MPSQEFIGAATAVIALICTTVCALPALAQTPPPAEAAGNAQPAEVPSGSATFGLLSITGGFLRATLPGQPVGGGYLTISNGGSADDRLLAVTSPAAGAVDLHQMRMDGDVMRMSAVPDGIVVPAGGSITLEPGGLHLMFSDLAAPLLAGEVVEVTLVFERAGEVVVVLPVLPVGAIAPMANM